MHSEENDEMRQGNRLCRHGDPADSYLLSRASRKNVDVHWRSNVGADG